MVSLSSNETIITKWKIITNTKISIYPRKIIFLAEKCKDRETRPQTVDKNESLRQISKPLNQRTLCTPQSLDFAHSLIFTSIERSACLLVTKK